MNKNIQDALASFTYGLYVVTVAAGNVRNAMVASWVSQASYDPPRVLVGIKKTRLTHELLERADRFGLMVVQKGKEGELPSLKGGDPEKKFTERDVMTGESGVPLFTEFLWSLELVLVDRFDAGDHTIFLGEITDAKKTAEGAPASTADYGKVYIGRQ
ncbi:MAG: flavin reductase [Deltaproteobacteria bacterium]|nr:flavin reductase [Candidatus Zymogenaceae bacterium]